MATSFPYPESFHTKRPKTASVLKAFIHKRTPSEGSTLSPASPPPHDGVFVASPSFEQMTSCYSHDYTHDRALTDIAQNQQSSLSPLKTTKEGLRPKSGIDGRGLHKKTLSVLSLKSLASPTKDADKSASVREGKGKKPKKTKSSTNIVNLLSRPKSSKSLRLDVELAVRNSKDKENRTPDCSSPVPDSASQPPIYSQFSSEMFAKQPLGGKFLEDQIDLYTPDNYSPSKQRNFCNEQNTQPSLTSRDGSIRPHSTYLPSSFSIQDIHRKSGDNRFSIDTHRRVSDEKRQSCDVRTSGESRPSFQRASTSTSSLQTTSSKRGSRVMAAVSTFTAKARGAEAQQTLAQTPIPTPIAAAAKATRPPSTGSDSSGEGAKEDEATSTKKKKRPRSRTFTLSRSGSKERVAAKDKKSEGTIVNKKSQESMKEGNRSLTSASAAVAQNLIAKAKGQCPDDFVSYLRKVQKPELVEVGRLHKLRLLLRNETVAWTDTFIRQGGMEEIVGLLHRTMEVEEEHEDALLHEVLLCLKALATTALALQHLNVIQKTLFPALLHMLFDEEKKGPAEFTTRNIVTSLLFTYLKSASLGERATRARFLLSYLRDPEPTESERPVDFVLDMHRQRPYKVWCKEVTNVTKEVFWIFLHNLNVIPLPGSRHAPEQPDEFPPDLPYMIKYFPQELPPVPAAPYVGGVEWDATNYLASHLDIINGCIASLPTLEERNQVRDELRISGWEKCMGSTLRTCKEKFYGGVHAGLRCWVAAAAADGWETRDVRCGPSAENKSPVRKQGASPKKVGGALVEQAPPKIDMKLSFAQNGAATSAVGDVWI
ncbi:gtpase binding rid1 protein [Rutstroemia sp. NJR-2017a BBW]|nr:gtpase binding rid1 protein [Rutstroemia sp. NJR-2017a BBW]